jgi:hypothetical protein
MQNAAGARRLLGIRLFLVRFGCDDGFANDIGHAQRTTTSARAATDPASTEPAWTDISHIDIRQKVDIRR